MSKSQKFRAVCMVSTAAAALALGSSAIAAQADNVYQFDIQGESLSQALKDYGLKTSQQIIFSENLTRGQAAPVLHGQYTSHDALTALLDKTDLTASREQTGVLMIQKKVRR